jgi:hypothetical protein
MIITKKSLVAADGLVNGNLENEKLLTIYQEKKHKRKAVTIITCAHHSKSLEYK